jgi:hypothetical protein
MMKSCCNIVGKDIGTIQKNEEALLDISKKIGLEVNVEKSKYLLMSFY